ncbi:unnamed protein product [Rodentolepis nana]|uniref:Transmembrane protein n=1 Tax=Rodentolepis nana TaxID=102285 RepID=A0A0R3TG50_RODNA|nr:unnamed protein product [Rodentolepis nana]
MVAKVARVFAVDRAIVVKVARVLAIFSTGITMATALFWYWYYYGNFPSETGLPDFVEKCQHVFLGCWTHSN